MATENVENESLVEFILNRFPQPSIEPNPETVRSARHRLWDYKSVFGQPFEYHHLVDFILSKKSRGVQFGDQDWLKQYESIISELPMSYNMTKFLLSMPILSYRIENISSLPFTKKASKSIDVNLGIAEVFKREFKIGIFSCYVNNIESRNIKGNLHFVMSNSDLKSRAYLQSLYTQKYQVLSKPSISDVTQVIKPILESVCSFLGLELKCQVPLELTKSPIILKEHEMYHTPIADFAALKNGEIVCPVLVKEAPLFHETDLPPSLDSLSRGEMENTMNHLQSYMILSKSECGILTDGYYLVVVRIVRGFKLIIPKSRSHKNYSKMSLQNLKPREYKRLAFRLDVEIVDVKSSCPTFLEILVHILFAASKSESFSEIYESTAHTDVPEDDIEQVRRYRFINYIEQKTAVLGHNHYKMVPKVTKKFLNYKSEATLIKEPDYRLVIYKIRAKFLKDIIEEDIEDDQFVAVKIFDPELHYEPLKKPYVKENAPLGYSAERKASSMLMNVPDYNNIYLKHKEVYLTYDQGYGAYVSGEAIISRFIESKWVPATPEMYNAAKEQLRIINDSGIIHGDTRRVNMAFDGKLYLFDLNHCFFVDNFEDYGVAKTIMKKDFRILKEVFSTEPKYDDRDNDQAVYYKYTWESFKDYHYVVSDDEESYSSSETSSMSL